ncbi:hypothetical protein [Clostridium beijerinckii]|uniref:hypothetical protein n=1 Tax=Clostridium beijerinckii TaxID=1520 RepID=UPI00047D4C26|nr:hypothetical protein [Clostridium beijerinckii]
MKKEIYNKKKFWSGIVFLLIAAVSISFIILRFNNTDTLKIIKYLVLDGFCVLFGVTEVYRSLSVKCTKEDMQNNDERENFINMKSKSSAFNITFFICIVITVLSIIGLAITKNIILCGFFVGIGIVPTIMVVADIASYIYYDMRN